MRVAELKALAQERLSRLREEGAEPTPVHGRGKALAEHFWGQAWMRHLARCEAGGLCLAPGRSLLRNGCVLDVKLQPGEIHALISAEELYEVHLRIRPLDDERTEELCRQCCGRIESLVSLMEGRLDDAVLTVLCDAETGLLPEPADWHMFCECPDWTEPCAHAAAAVYATGVLIDADPSLLFLLRGVDPASLIRTPELADTAAFDASALGALFGIELDTE